MAEASSLKEDPRICPDFEPACYPLCDGGEAPAPGTGDRTERRKLEFLSVYYHLNRLYGKLALLQGSGCHAQEGPVLQEIEAAICARNQLEELYESEGFLAEPAMDGVFYKNIEFTYAGQRKFYTSEISSKFSLYLPVPPPGTDVQEWAREQVERIFEESRSRETTNDVAPDRPAKE